MSSLSGPLQVVPDIDDQVANPENPQEVGFPAFHRTDFCASLSVMAPIVSPSWEGQGGESLMLCNGRKG